MPKTLDEALTLEGVLRSGGTDLQELRHLPIFAQRPVIDLRDVAGLDAITLDDQGAWIGGAAIVQQVADHPAIGERWPGLAQACGALANPQIRNVASLAGSLLQAPRCWYYRHPDYTCLRKGGDTCYARGGDHLFHVCFDTQPCAAPHPSTPGMALLAYEAKVELLVPGDAAPRQLAIAELLEPEGMPEGGLITAIRLGPPLAQERSAYVRASNRAYAEWALVEVLVRLRFDGEGTIDFARVCVGAVASTPLRLTELEAALVGQKADAANFERVAALARAGANPLPMTGYKLDLLDASVLEALEQAASQTPSPILTPTPTPTPTATAVNPGAPTP
ncbi:FAD binding domain-containing protein [Nannocystaceae bacterium ST9]